MADASDEKEGFSLLNPFETFHFDLEEWAGGIKQWSFENRDLFRPLREPLDWLINNIEDSLQASPQSAVIAAVGLLAWQFAGWRVGLASTLLLIVMGLLSEQSWNLGMTTLAIVVAAVIICIVIGFPLGLWAGKSNTVQSIMRPILDTMQTIPAFVYLVPVVLLLGIGNVPGVIVTVVFAVPPLIRLTSLGIRHVDPSVIEAMYAFGAKPMQVLFKAEIPLAMPSIMAGVNQAIMLSLSMVVIASMIAVKGFGNEVLRAIGRLDAGKAIIGGVGIVILAIVLDRITQGIGRIDAKAYRLRWHETGPAAIFKALYARLAHASATSSANRTNNRKAS